MKSLHDLKRALNISDGPMTNTISSCEFELCRTDICVFRELDERYCSDVELIFLYCFHDSIVARSDSDLVYLEKHLSIFSHLG